MPAFRFALQALLDRRERIERDRAAAAAHARRAAQSARAELATVHAELVGGSELLSANIDARHRSVLDCESRWEDARGAFEVARREHQVLQKLRERRRQRFEAERERALELELDEANRRSN